MAAKVQPNDDVVEGGSEDHHEPRGGAILLSAECLPPEVLLLAMSFLDLGGLLSASAACRRWREVSFTNSLWRKHCLERWQWWPSSAPASFRPTSSASSSPPESSPSLRSSSSSSANWRSLFFERVHKDKSAEPLLHQMCNLVTRDTALKKLKQSDLGMYVFESVQRRLERWQKERDDHLTHIYYGRVALKEISEENVEQDWRLLLASHKPSNRSQQQADGEEEDEEAEEAEQERNAQRQGEEEVEGEIKDEAEERRKRHTEWYVDGKEPEVERGAALLAALKYSLQMGITQQIYSKLADYALAVKKRLMARARNAEDDSGANKKQRKDSDTTTTTKRKKGEEESEDEDFIERLWHWKNPYKEGWSEGEILEELNAYLFDEQKFKGEVEHYYDPKNSFLNDVLERHTGIPITLSVIYSAVARRLGIVLDLISMPCHFLLRWYDSENQREVFVDAYNRGRQLTRQECIEMLRGFGVMQILPTYFRPVSIFVLYERMLSNLNVIYQSSRQMRERVMVVRLLSCFPGQSEDELLLLAKMYVLIEEFTKAEDLLIKILEEKEGDARLELELLLARLREAKKIKPKQHNEMIRFHVGSIISHKLYGYRGVIFGWDESCQASDMWMLQMGVHGLPHGKDQPFYQVLVEESDRPNQTTYVAQENIVLVEEPNVRVQQEELGAYFSRYEASVPRYVPNEDLLLHYPSN
ncbi:F-box protein 21 [Balamuthia mandrillaris]